MSVRRRWSDTVLAEYRDDGNPFGGYLVRVLETVDTQQNERDSNAGSWENEWDRRDESSPVPARHLFSPGSEHHDGTSTTRHLRKR
jgi:hypothetical protein